MLGHTVATDRGADRNEQDEPNADSRHQSITSQNRSFALHSVHGDGQTTTAAEANARLNQILDRADFDGYVEARCQRFYADEIGRPGLPPKRCFRLLLIGHFEGLAGAGLVKGKTVGIDATTLEANAALRSIVRRDTARAIRTS